MGLALASLDRLTAVDLPLGGTTTLHGALTTSIDGSVFDAAMQWDGLSPGAVREPGLFDLAAGGLRVVEQHPDRHVYVLAATNIPSPVCASIGATTCLVPRLGALAHERLRTEGELVATLSGGVAVEGPTPPSVGSVASYVGVRMAAFMVGALVAAALVWLVCLLFRRSRTPVARVRAVARDALAATRGDPSLAFLRGQVAGLGAHAEQVEATRRAHVCSLGRIDRAGIERRIEACVRRGGDDGDVLAWLSRERAEGERLARELSACVAKLERIESALRVVAIQARDRRHAGHPRPRVDPVDAVALELELRAAAWAETDRAVG